MGVVGKILSPILSLTGVFKKPKMPKPQAPLPTITPRANSVLVDAIARRRGSADNQRSGAGGAESSAGAKKQFMGQ